MVIFVLTLTAFVASAISGIVGMGGGALLLAIMLSFLSHGEAIPLHAAVQMCSNGTRMLAFRAYTEWRIVGKFAVGLLPGVVVSFALLYLLGELGTAEPYLKLLIGIYILATTFLSRTPTGRQRVRDRQWMILGFVVGVASLTVGAIGPLIAELFARQGFVKERLIATKAVCQMVSHVTKLPAFALLGTIHFVDFSGLLVCMIAAVIPGTLLGKRLLRYVSPEAFKLVYKTALVLAGTKILIVDDLLAIMS